ncbi:hypothetical protein Tco_0942002 [Tanacetum coccineum]|uniref:Uncharacterized protein n=1 Tax=Tanacetum coccineum TaxID=301880 RepID=A0ABQ5DUY3_9ASTR
MDAWKDNSNCSDQVLKSIFNLRHVNETRELLMFLLLAVFQIFLQTTSILEARADQAKADQAEPDQAEVDKAKADNAKGVAVVVVVMIVIALILFCVC